MKKKGYELILVYIKKSRKLTFVERNLFKTIFTEISEIEISKHKWYEILREVIYKLTGFEILKNKKIIMSSEEVIQSLYKKYNFDILHCGGIELAYLFRDIRNFPRLIDLVDSTSLYLKREYQTNSNPLNRFIKFITYLYNIRIENYITKSWSNIIVVSQIDKVFLDNKKNNSQIRVIPMGIDGNYYNPKNIEKYKWDFPTILFHGTMSFKPNEKAVLYISKEIYPLIKQDIPELRFYIVGKNPPPKIRNLQKNKDIIVTGFVEDIRPYILSADIILEPMISGSGFKDKILESMAMQKPVVTNPLGAEAFNKDIRSILFIGNTNKVIVNQVINLLKRNNLRKKYGTLGRELVNKNHNWVKIAEQFENVYKDILISNRR